MTLFFLYLAVFAVEPTRIAHFARQICKENGIEDSVSVIQSKIEVQCTPHVLNSDKLILLLC